MTPIPRVISALTSVAGAGVLAALTASAAFSITAYVVTGPPTPDGPHAPATAGLTADGTAGGTDPSDVEEFDLDALHVDAQGGGVTITFGDVPDATLEASGQAPDSWRWEWSGQTLTATNDGAFSGICFFWCTAPAEEVTITLPEELDGALWAEFDLSSGRLSAEGDFTGVDIDVAAGTLDYAGAAPAVSLKLGAGTADLSLTGTRSADFDIAAGNLTAVLRGSAPDQVQVDLAAGELDLSVPDVPYSLRSDVAGGRLKNNLRTAPDSAHIIEVELAAGRASLSPL